MAIPLRHLLHLLLILILAGDVPISSHASSPDATAMASIAQSLIGVPTSWVPGSDPCDPKWELVSCMGGRVISLNLANKSLSGVLSQSINDLNALTAIHLQNNNISGPIPSLTSLSNLQMLYLDFNTFTSIQDDFFSGLNSIMIISLDYNPLAVWSISDEAYVCSNLQRFTAMNTNLNGSIPEIFGSFSALQSLRLSNNDLTGTIPQGLAGLKQLQLLDLSNNDLHGKVPNFSPNVTLKLHGNPSLGKDDGGGGNTSPSPPPMGISPPRGSNPPHGTPSGPVENPPPSVKPQPPPPPPSPRRRSSTTSHWLSRNRIYFICLAVALAVILAFFCFIICPRQCKWSKTFDKVNTDCHNDMHDATEKGLLRKKLSNGLHFGKKLTQECGNAALMKTQCQPMSLKTLKKATNNFNEANILGQGGFGVVYRGELNGTTVAVKRSKKSGFGELKAAFDAEIDVLKSARHRNLVALLGYCIEGNERLLVYEFMSMGTLADHLFGQYKDRNCLSWKQRLAIALDVARGIEYLHSLAQETFIHRDLKPTNILLDKNFRAKVSDFGLVKMADTMRSMTTKVAGTFGYLAPEYAINGRASRKVDVYSFGVVLMEIITSKKALDQSLPEEELHIVYTFNKHHEIEHVFKDFVDPTFLVDEEAYNCLCKASELAIHCTASEPQHRPDMSHVVSVLAPMLEQWTPSSGPLQAYSDIEFSQEIERLLKLDRSSSVTDASIQSPRNVAACTCIGVNCRLTSHS
ncbi:hypothetical protein J5N97_020369 [Dioscorea zingiberensis]|uniref:Protein kinase domain-containing protein n=1 Tax=Dioscorea zingiberensis TaxID=325984 RepID=A0A9D5CGD3_9LILI|nr:hypothetical protein J5N97_020369 [Dioscorea zingiberensis]